MSWTRPNVLRLLLLAVPLVAEHRRALLDDDAPVLLGCGCTARNSRRPVDALSHGSSAASDRAPDAVDGVPSTPRTPPRTASCLPAEVVVERALGDPAPATISSRLVPAYPWAAKSSGATSTSARLVDAEYSCAGRLAHEVVRGGPWRSSRSIAATVPTSPRVGLIPGTASYREYVPRYEGDPDAARSPSFAERFARWARTEPTRPARSGVAPPRPRAPSSPTACARSRPPDRQPLRRPRSAAPPTAPPRTVSLAAGRPRSVRPIRAQPC